VKQACAKTEPQTSVLIGPSETAEQTYPGTEAGADFAARAVTRDVVGEWLLTLAQGCGMGP
jgi:hypothetical protein